MRPSTCEALPMPEPEIDPAANPAPALTPRARRGLVILGILTLVWISRMPVLDVKRQAPTPRFEAFGSRPDIYTITGLRDAALDRDVPVFKPGRNIFEFASRVDARWSGERNLRQREFVKGGTKRERSTSEPALDVDVLGVFGPQRLRIAVLKYKSGEGVTNLLERDVVESRYRVLEIDSTSVLLRDTVVPDAAPIRLELPGGNRRSGL